VRDSQDRLRMRSAASALIVSIALFATSACSQERGSRDDAQITRWRGMRVEAGPGFTIHDEDTSLVVRQSHTPEQLTYGSIHFKWINPPRPQSFERGRKKCLAETKYKCQLDSATVTSAECFGLEDGSLADSDFTASGDCASKDRTIEARYACWNDGCRRVKLMIATSLASLAWKDSL
jgi:hypothetical protein